MKNNNKKFFNKLSFRHLFFLLFFIFIFTIPVNQVKAQMDTIGGPVAVIRKITDWLEKNKDKLLVKIGSKVYQTTLQAALNTIAYDAANYISSGGQGQKPLFSREYLTEFGKNAGEAAVSQFIDELSKNWQVNLCNPNLDFKLKIGLGLTAQNKPEFYKPNCSWQEMKKNWASEYDKWTSANNDAFFLDKLSNVFDPTSNDLTIALEVFNKSFDVGAEEQKKYEEELKKNQGWLDVRNIAGKTDSPPATAKRTLEKADDTKTKNLATFTGDALVDASNIFLNQLYISLWNNTVKNIAKSVPNSSSPSFSNAGEDSNVYSGTKYLSESLKKIIKPKFNIKTDYDILSDLVMCIDAKNPAPNNCVINEYFSQAIQNQNTVIEAIDNGYISPNLVFDRNTDYQSGLNYRSLVILRKFRIIPLGWEEALTRTEEQTLVTGQKYTLMDMISCFDSNDEYKTFSKGFSNSNFTNYSWCEGLVDPNWVLKSNLNYCKKQGYGGYVYSKQLINVPEDSNVKPIIISRSDNYCADEQSCIKENANGTCEYYGYCTEEKRTWNFGEDSCDAVYNTCDTFTSSSSGKKLALLQNTINYGTCNADNAGCTQYVNSGNYSSSSSKINWNDSSSIYFNNKIETCVASADNCQEFIRATSGSGHNFLVNGDFENSLEGSIWNGLSLDTKAYAGKYSISFISPIEKSISVAPENYVISGENYTLSFYSLCSGSSTSTVSLGSKIQDIANSTDFSYQAIKYAYPSNYSSNLVNFTINPNGNTCLVDNIKLEKGTTGTFYSNYRDNNLYYQKIIPDYLKTTCYLNPFSTTPDYRLKADAPSVCFQYARLCNNNEVGCELFTSIYGIKTPARALDKDYCPSQCVGYDIYVKNNTLFEEKSIDRFIPSTARVCSVNDSGCTEFTNLDTLSSGGEAREYYSYLRHCIKSNQGTCDNFYSWEGSSESGYQLRSFRLEKENLAQLPKVTEGTFIDNGNISNHIINGVEVCSKAIYKLSVSNPLYNSDCREFYTQDGKIIYVLYSKTITCSDNCKTYRMTEKNINTEISNVSDCSALNTSSAGVKIANWDESLNVCYHCLSGGRWDDVQGACLYQAIPGEGKTCQASNNNCREYNGNSGNNVKIINSYDFNNGIESWTGGSESTESLSQGGKSINITNSAEVNVGNTAKEGSSYIIKFLAKSSQSTKLDIEFTNGSETSLFGVAGENQNYSISIPASNDWQLYQVNLEKLNHLVDNSEKLKISVKDSGKNIYIANIVVLEIGSRYYLIRDSWNTPEICYYDTAQNYRGINYNLGCQTYKDRANTNHDLRQFTSLCDSSAVGCEIMTQTNNYNSNNSAIFKDKNNDGACGSDEDGCIFIPADKFVSVVYDSSKACSSANKGCSRFGKVILSNAYITSQNVYQDIYLKNDPNKYDVNLCEKEDVGCDLWTSSLGSQYFKDPGNNICYWRKGKDVNSNFAWYKSYVKKCQNNSNQIFTNNLCLGDSDCSSDQSCKEDTRDFLCPVDSMKTIGLGGDSPIYQPGEEIGVKWAGLCPMKDAGCTEYIDPISSFSPNIILNPTFSDLDNDGVFFDLWEKIGVPYVCFPILGNIVCINDNGQNIFNSSVQYIQKNLNILPNKLYILKTNGLQNATLNCQSSIYELLSEKNIFGDAVKEIKVDKDINKKIFYSANNENSCDITYSKEITGVGSGDYSIEVKEVIIDYQLAQNLNAEGCNSANFNNGCVVFNERAFNKSSSTFISPLNFKASNYANYSTCSGQNCDANKLIKATPNRVCGKWLSCGAYTVDPSTKEKTCVEIGECTAFNQDGTCFNFSKAPDGVRKYTVGRDDNATGYSVLGLDYLANMKEAGVGTVFVDDFEEGLNNWTIFPTTNKPKPEDCLVDKPNSKLIIDSSVSYPASGLNFLSVDKDNCTSISHEISSSEILPNSSYYLSIMVNTENLGYNEKASIYIVPKTSSNNNDYGDCSIGSGLSLFLACLSQSLVEMKANLIHDIVGQNGWNEITFKFTAKDDWLNGINIVLINSNNKPVYFDNIRIEPVLETVKSNEDSLAKFTSQMCRLYPSQDSLLCESENKNFIANGWYGYCLQKDPQNSDVCLLWYPIDVVRGGRGSSGATSAYPGYPTTGKNPYYCLEMSANFDIVEFRKAYKIKVEKVRGDNNYIEFVDNINCPNGYNVEYKQNKDGEANNCGDILGVCSGGTWYKLRISYCVPEKIKVIGKFPSFQYENTMIIKEDDFTFPIVFSNNNNRSLRSSCDTSSGCGCCPKNDSTNCNVPESDNYYECVHESITESNKCSSLRCSSFQIKSSSEGWYLYDKKDGIEEDPKVLAYDYTQSDCSKFGGEWYATNQIETNFQGNLKHDGVCLVDYDKFAPKCTQIIKGEIPWVQRLQNDKKLLGDYASGSSDYPIPSYKKNSPSNPYGAINTASLSSSDSVFASVGTAPFTGALFGVPYSCNDFEKKVGDKSTCRFLKTDNNNKISISLQASNNYYLETTNTLKLKVKYLKNIWLKVSKILGDFWYNFSNIGYDIIPKPYSEDPKNLDDVGPEIKGYSGERSDDSVFRAYFPTITNIKLTNNFGISINPDKDQIYSLNGNGFYTLSFNTKIDAEQAPISKLVIRMIEVKEDGTSDWTSASGIYELNNIDNSPDSNNPFRLTKYLTKGNYRVLINVIDNWGFYKCVGLNQFNSSSLMQEGSECYKCCVDNSFKNTDEKQDCTNCK